jgi:hypothetical protein
MNLPPPHERDAYLQAALKKSVADATTIALVFILLGGLGMLIASQLGWRQGPLLAGSCGMMLLGPGVLYFIAGGQIKRRKPSGARMARMAAACHLAVIPGSVFVYATFGRHFGSIGFVLVPATISVFFVPALIAFLFSMTKAVRIARAIESEGHGFQVMAPKPVIPVGDHPEDRVTEQR